MNNETPTRAKTVPGLIFSLVLAAGTMTLAGNGVSANEAAKDTTPSDFPDYSQVQGYQLQPGSKILTANATQILRVVNCAPAAAGPDDRTRPINICEGIDDGEVDSPATISDWSVNGVVGGNSIVGTIKGNRDTAIYTAPAKKPTPNTVAVSAKVNLTGSQNPLLVSNITISHLS